MSNARKALAGALAALCVLAAALPALAQTEPSQAARSGLDWMKAQQQADGSFPGFGAGSTVDALLAIIASGDDPATYSKGSNTPLTFLASKVSDLAKTPGGAGKLLLAAESVSPPSNSIGGVNLVDTINKSYDPKTGHYGQDAIGHAFAMLGLHAAGEKVPAGAANYLKSVQNSDGGWSYSGETGQGKADTNSTAVALQALVVADVDKSDPLVIKKAVTYLASQQNADGGYPYQKGGQSGSDSDVNSTAYVVQAMTALGNTTMAEQGLSFIRSMQNPDGAFHWQAADKSDNPGATYQAVPALLGATLISPVARAIVPGGGGAVSPGTKPSDVPPTGQADFTLTLPLAVALFAGLMLAAGLGAHRLSNR